MKKSLFFLAFLFLPFSVFAWTDTDRICVDNWLWWQTTEMISVNYPWVSVQTSSPWKIARNIPATNQTSINLYYAVNIFDSKNPNILIRSELYSYDCDSKKPKILLKIPVNRENKEYMYYEIDKILDDSIVLHWWMGAMMDQELYDIIVYDIKKSKKIFSIKNGGILPSFSTISWFTTGKDAWYIYLENLNDEGYSPQSASLFRIDKKTKKITKL